MKEVIVRLTSDHIKVKGGQYVRDLVRCGECRQWLNNSGLCKHWSKLYGSVLTKADDFCSYGEREDE